ncbi:MAG: cytochrome c [Burkholderiales bacterium]|nr:cytochrome c [Burkholderiales bacterium]
MGGDAGAQGDGAARRELGREVFLSRAKPACAVCHTLEAAGATGAVGPVLDELRPDADRVAKAVRNGLGVMPSFRALLSEAEIEAVAHFVATATAAPK